VPSILAAGNVSITAVSVLAARSIINASAGISFQIAPTVITRPATFGSNAPNAGTTIAAPAFTAHAVAFSALMAQTPAVTSGGTFTVIIPAGDAGLLTAASGDAGRLVTASGAASASSGSAGLTITSGDAGRLVTASGGATVSIT
jgi:hypothetical protein